MNEANIVKVIRMLCGVVLLAIHAVTDVNGMIVATGLFLLGAPVELLTSGKKEETLEEKETGYLEETS